jgi:hypothetical protein
VTFRSSPNSTRSSNSSSSSYTARTRLSPLQNYPLRVQTTSWLMDPSGFKKRPHGHMDPSWLKNRPHCHMDPSWLKNRPRFLVREDALKAEQRNCPTKDEQNKLWSRVPKGGPIPRLTGRLTVGRKKNSNSSEGSWTVIHNQ